MEIIREPKGFIKNAFNNCVLEFKSQLEDVVRGLVDIEGNLIELQPMNGVFYVNLKEVITSIVNQHNFKDEIKEVPPLSYVFPDANLHKEIKITLVAFGLKGATEVDYLTYNFLLGVDDIYVSNIVESEEVRLLQPSENDHKHYTYFEGLPFCISIYSNISRDVTILHTGTQITKRITLTKGVNRVFISNGENDNKGFEGDMPLYLGLNEMQIIRGAQTIYFTIDKKEVGCGNYLKWFNSKGSWSYWRFSPVWQKSINTKENTLLGKDEYNYDQYTADFESTGKSASVTISMHSGQVSTKEQAYFTEIYQSPKVYLYTQDNLQPYKVTDFREVLIKGGNTQIFNNKTQSQEYKVTVEIPNLKSQHYAS